MADKFLFIPNDDTQNCPFCRFKLKRLNTQLNKPTNQISVKVPKVVKQMNKKNVIVKLW